MPTNVTGTKPAAAAEDSRALVDALLSATDAQIDQYIAANVTDLASARVFLRRLTKILRALARRAAR